MNKTVLMTILTIIVLSFSISGCKKEEPICGNGMHEEGEGYSNCCKDAGCPTGKICIDNECIVEVNCGQCQYKENGVCKDYPCCLDVDCDDNNISTIDKCIKGFTKQAECQHTLQTECINGDNVCPENCDTTNDTDCEDTVITVSDCGESMIILMENGTIENPENFDCFISSSQNCDLAKFKVTANSVIFGVNSTGRTYYELKGMDSGKCIFYLLNEYSYIYYTDELIESLLDANYTQEEIDEMEQQAQNAVEQTIGNDGTCLFNIQDLSTMLTRWKSGQISSGVNCKYVGDEYVCTPTGDFEVAECSGNYWGGS